MKFTAERELIALSKNLPENLRTTIQGDLKSRASSDEDLYEISFLVTEDLAREIISAVGQVGRRLRTVRT